jgi:hypothetical protein
MILKQSFDDFVGKISLDQSRRDRIQTAHITVRDYLEGHEDMKGRNPKTFLQGSYKLHTAVKPQREDGSYDVDVVMLANLDDIRSNGGNSVDWLTDVLSENDRYKNKIDQSKINARCVRLQYENDFHMDIIPAHPGDDQKDGIILVPHDWKKSHPHGFKEWCLNKQKDTNDYFYTTVRLLKWWRNLKWGDEGHPKSILLTTLVGNNIPADGESIDKVFIKTIIGMNSYLSQHAFVPKINNPSLSSENISASWSLTDFIEFKSRLSGAAVAAQKALDSRDEQETIDIWNSEELFNGSFPKTIRGLGEEAKKINELLKAGTLTMSTTGYLGSAPTQRKVYPTKFYGDV